MLFSNFVVNPRRVTAVEGADEFPAITYESCVMRLRQGAVGRALEYLRDCGKDKVRELCVRIHVDVIVRVFY